MTSSKMYIISAVLFSIVMTSVVSELLSNSEDKFDIEYYKHLEKRGTFDENAGGPCISVLEARREVYGGKARFIVFFRRNTRNIQVFYDSAYEEGHYTWMPANTQIVAGTFEKASFEREPGSGFFGNVWIKFTSPKSGSTVRLLLNNNGNETESEPSSSYPTLNISPSGDWRYRDGETLYISIIAPSSSSTGRNSRLTFDSELLDLDTGVLTKDSGLLPPDLSDFATFNEVNTGEMTTFHTQVDMARHHVSGVIDFKLTSTSMTSLVRQFVLVQRKVVKPKGQRRPFPRRFFSFIESPTDRFNDDHVLLKECHPRRKCKVFCSVASGSLLIDLRMYKKVDDYNWVQEDADLIRDETSTGIHTTTVGVNAQNTGEGNDLYKCVAEDHKGKQPEMFIEVSYADS